MPGVSVQISLAHGRNFQDLSRQFVQRHVYTCQLWEWLWEWLKTCTQSCHWPIDLCCWCLRHTWIVNAASEVMTRYIALLSPTSKAEMLLAALSEVWGLSGLHVQNLSPRICKRLRNACIVLRLPPPPWTDIYLAALILRLRRLVAAKILRGGKNTKFVQVQSRACPSFAWDACVLVFQSD